MSATETAGRTDAPAYLTIPLDMIDDEHGSDVRRVAGSKEADAALAASITRRGVLEPILCRPTNGRFLIVFGRRRLRCARLAGLAGIPAQVRDMTDAEAAAADATENMQREALSPIDQWRAVADLKARGLDEDDIAGSLGLDARGMRQMERLGRLHPSIIGLIEVAGMPKPGELRSIANAPIELQAKAAKNRDAVPPRAKHEAKWWQIANMCQVQRIARSLAIFDVVEHAAMFDEDLFAQPNDDERFTTSNVKQFLKLQTDALKKRVAEQVFKQKRRVQFTEIAADGMPKLLKGFQLVSTVPTAKPGKTECAFAAVRADGRVVEVVARDVLAQRAAERKQAAKEKQAGDKAAEGAEADQPAGMTDDEARQSLDAALTDGERKSLDKALDEVETASRAPVTQAGLATIATLKTEALREAVISLPRNGAEASIMLSLLLVALVGDNVDLRPFGTKADIAKLVHQLVPPGGGVTENDPELLAIAAKVIAAILVVGPPQGYAPNFSGAAAEWIGAAINAASGLPRFDDAEFLKTVTGFALVKVAEANQLDATGSIADLRKRLARALPAWRPDAAQFGAPAPNKPKKGKR